ncbi:hypothetical protein CRUP_004725 [Coryphaenoides rupestris]|nr:hypothetical protein CRUP_004725 [Coryphaenoides rupestris]
MLCWGNASYGQLGLGGIDEEIVIEPRPCHFFHGKRVCDVGCGRRHTTVLLEDGTVYTCGCNDLGQLGHEKSRKKPEQVTALDAQNIVAVSCGESHTLALNDKGQVFSWGLGSDGQLGLNNFEECVRVPRNIKSLTDVQITQVACGYRHSHALSKDRRSPTLLRSLRSQRVIYVCCGEDHTAALTKLSTTAHVCHPDHYNTSSKCSGVDMNVARVLYHKLIQPDHPEVAQQVAASLEKNLIPRLGCSPPDIEALRLYLTLPECPLFRDPNTYVTLAIPFAKSLISLKDAALKVLGHWWSALEPTAFQRLVELYKEVVVYLLRMHKVGIPQSEQRIYTCFLHTSLRLLEILHAVSDRAGHIIQYDKFYIHELDELIDIRNDYVTWIQQQMFPQGHDGSVTLCRYPFVFDAQAKTTLLQTDAVIQMQMAVDQAQRQNFSSMFLSVVESVNPCLILIVRRENIVEDTMEVLRKSKNVDYKKPLKV